MSTVFLDTVGILALFDARDQWHAAAERAWEQITAARGDFLTTSLVRAECANAAARRPYRSAVVELREALRDAAAIVDPSREQWESAWRAYAAGDASGPGVVDHVSFLAMRAHGVIRAFSNDRHFSAAGFEVLF